MTKRFELLLSIISIVSVVISGLYFVFSLHTSDVVQNERMNSIQQQMAAINTRLDRLENKIDKLG